MAFAPLITPHGATLRAPATWPPAPRAVPDTEAVLTAAGEVAYEWTISSDALVLSSNCIAVLGVEGSALASGRSFAALVAPENRSGRQEAVLGAKATDEGNGVRYEVQYALIPHGP